MSARTPTITIFIESAFHSRASSLPRFLSIEQRSPQRVRLRVIDVHVGELADQPGVVAAEVDDPVVLGTALKFARIFLRIVGDQDALGAADHLAADLETL